MKWRTFLAIVVCSTVLLSAANECRASMTYAYAAISKTGHGSDNDSDTDSAFGNCSSYADADCPYSGEGYNCGAYATTTSRVTVLFNPGGGPGSYSTIDISVTSSNNEASPYTGHTFTNNGYAYWGIIDARLIGAGVTAAAELWLASLDLTLPNTGSAADTTTIGLDLNIDDSTTTQARSPWQATSRIQAAASMTPPTSPSVLT